MLRWLSAFYFVIVSLPVWATIIVWDFNDVLVCAHRALDPLMYQGSPLHKGLKHRFRKGKKLNDGMLALVQELHHLGYEQHIASNIHPNSFAFFTDPIKCPHMKELFACVALNKSVTNMYQNGVLLKKPNPEYFRVYLRKNNLNPAMTPLIFIDDKKVNVRAAESVGMYGIIFKNALQIRDELNRYGVNVVVMR